VAGCRRREEKLCATYAEKLWLLRRSDWMPTQAPELSRALERGYKGSLCPDGRMACCTDSIGVQGTDASIGAPHSAAFRQHGSLLVQ